MRRVVVLVNGSAGAGKDTAIAMMRGLLQSFGWSTENYSSIDPVRELLGNAGIDVSVKTGADRDLLAEVGYSVEKHSSFRTLAVVARFMRFAAGRSNPHMMFVSIREHELVEKMTRTLTREGVEVKWMFVDRPVSKITSNAADANVPHKGLYEYIIDNSGSLLDLSIAVARTADNMVGLRQAESVPQA